MAFPPGAPAPQPQAAPGQPDDEADESPQTIEIEPQQDGSFAVSQGEGEPQVVPGVREVCALVEQLLSGGQDPKAAWAAEAAKRDPSGMPAQPGAGPSMSM